MAKKELNYGKLALPQKTDVVKKDNTAVVIEKAVETIHAAPTTISSPTPSVKSAVTDDDLPGRLKKISLDLPAEMYQFVKLHTFKRMITMREYMLELISEDMKRRGEL